jgi:hypothetical protein
MAKNAEALIAQVKRQHQAMVLDAVDALQKKK